MNTKTNITGSSIKTLRNELNLNKGEFADLLGTSRNTLRKWEEEGLDSISTAADRNLYHIYLLHNREILNKLLYNVKEDEKIDFLFALISFFGSAISMSKNSKKTLFTVSLEIINYLNDSNYNADLSIDDFSSEYMLPASAAQSSFEDPFSKASIVNTISTLKRVIDIYELASDRTKQSSKFSDLKNKSKEKIEHIDNED